MPDRQSLRTQIRKRRAGLDPAWCAAASTQICANLADSWLYRRARRIAFYLAQGREVNLELLLQDAWAAGKEVYLPVLGLRFSGRLWFVPCAPDTPLYKNRFGIDEPLHSPRARHTGLRELDLLLMPLVAFDRAGNRLGMGGGFYDRTLAGVHGSCRRWSRPKRIGIAYAMQSVDQIAGETWDVPLDAVVTECGLQWFAKETT